MELTRTSRLRIGYMPFYVDYYEGICPQFPHEKAEIARQCAQRLERFGPVIWDGQLIGDVEQAQRVGEALTSQDINCVVVVPTIAVFGGIPWAALQNINTPILLWNAQQINTVTADYSMQDIVRNTSQIGVQALANTLLRHGRPFRVITGYDRSAQVDREMNIYFRTMKTALTIRRAKLLEVGGVFPLMTDVELDEKRLAEHLGTTTVHILASELTERFNAVDVMDVQQHVDQLRHDHKVVQIEDDELSRSARLCIAFDRLVEEHHADAGSLNCHASNCLQNPAIGVTACYSLGVQNSCGRSFTCTGDLCTALAMLMLKTLTGAAMYTEVQVMDQKRGGIVIANSGEGEDAIRRDGCKSRVIGNRNFLGLHGRGASFAYALKPGPATLISFTPTPHNDKPYRLIVAEGDILEEHLPDAGTLAGFFRFASGATDLHAGYKKYLEAGPVHHAATAPGHWSEALRDLCDLLDIEFTGV